MVKEIYDFTGDSETSPASTLIIQTSESNLDIVQFNGDYNLDLTNNDEFSYYDAKNQKIFAGYIRESENGDESVYVGYDYGIELAEIPIRKNFEGFTALEIMEDIITNYTSLTWVTPTGITDSAVIKLYPSRNRKANQIMDAMHKFLGTTNYVDFDKNYMIEYEGQETNTNVLEVGVNCITTADGWITNSLNLVKNLTVTGDVKTIEEIQTLTGDGVTTEFTLASPYTDIKIEYPSGSGTFLTPYVEDVVDGDFDILREVKKINFISFTPANGVNFDVYYVYEIETNFEIIEVSQAQVLSGVNPHHKVINVPYLKEVIDCKDYATKYKVKFGEPVREVTLLVNALDALKYRANQSIRIKDNTHLVNGEFVDDIFIIKRLERSWGQGGYFVKLVCGDSTQFVYDRSTEISQRIDEFNETNPLADIFNQGISTLDGNSLIVEYETTVKLYKGTLPSNVLVYNASRTYTDEGDYPSGSDYVYINESVYNALFTEVTE